MPNVLTSLSSFNGSDPAAARVTNVTDAGFDVFTQEETSADAEVAHIAESVDLLAIEGDGLLSAHMTRPVVAEFGQTTLSSSSSTINLQHNFENPVVFALPASANGSDPVTVRITDIQSGQFTARLQEPNNLDDVHTNETVHWIVMEEGSWRLPDGTYLEVGSLDSNSLTSAGFETVSFSNAFDAAPSIFSQVQTDAGADWVVTRQNNASNTGFQLAMQEEEALNGGGHIIETLGWFAIERAVGTWDGSSFEAGTTGDSVTDAFATQNFSQSFHSAPNFFASLASFDGADPSNVRYQNLSSSSVEVNVDEETSFDAELGHTTETIDYFAIEGGSGILRADSWDDFFNI